MNNLPSDYSKRWVIQCDVFINVMFVRIQDFRYVSLNFFVYIFTFWWFGEIYLFLFGPIGWDLEMAWKEYRNKDCLFKIIPCNNMDHTLHSKRSMYRWEMDFTFPRHHLSRNAKSHIDLHRYQVIQWYSPSGTSAFRTEPDGYLWEVCWPCCPFWLVSLSCSFATFF